MSDTNTVSSIEQHRLLVDDRDTVPDDMDIGPLPNVLRGSEGERRRTVQRLDSRTAISVLRQIREEIDGLRDDVDSKFEEQDQLLTGQFSSLHRKITVLRPVRSTVRRKSAEIREMKRTVRSLQVSNRCMKQWVLANFEVKPNAPHINGN